jgi:hypothetical protein
MNRPTLDLSLFRWIESQTSESDRRALLSIREALCGSNDSYRYLEVGSHLGGSLQPHVLDIRCTSIISIDPRPLEQADERWQANYRYEGNSTERMLTLLSQIPAADIGKIQTFETNASDLSVANIPVSVDFAFIDGEHTNSAVIRDFNAVRRFLAPASILAFHDCFVTLEALVEVRRTLSREEPKHGFFYFPKSDVVSIAFHSDQLMEALLRFGWKPGLPNFRWRRFKLVLAKRWPGIVSALRRYRSRCDKLR